MDIGEPSGSIVSINGLDAESYISSDVLYAQWDRFNAMILAWIMNMVSQDVYMGLVYSENVATVWKESVADYYHKLNSLWREFDAMTKPPKCTCEVKCSCDASKEFGLHQQLVKLMQFLRLDDCYHPVRSSLLTRDPLLEVKDAYNVVYREESHRGVPESSSVTEFKQNATSLNSNTGKQTFNANADIKMNDKSSSPSLSSGFTPEQMQKLLSMINDKPSGNIHANMAGRASFFNGNVWFNINFSKYFFANSSLSVTTISMGWIIDSGANQHLTVSTVGMYNVVDI
ncbi:hypothetical protein Tco_1230801, partial [Tanacetum coccineum]